MSFLLTVLAIIFFYWLFISSNKGSFTTTKKALPFEHVLYSEFGYIMALIAKLAKSDGHVSDLEVELIESTLDDLCSEFHDPIAARVHLKLIFKEEKEIQDNVVYIAQELYKKTSRDTFKHQKIIEFMITLAYVDGTLHPKEEDIIFKTAKAFRMGVSAVDRIFAQFRNFYEERTSHAVKTDEHSYYQILGLDENYDQKSLKSAYKKGVKENHPDIIMGKGGSKEDINHATQKLQDLNEAYEYLKKKKGF